VLQTFVCWFLLFFFCSHIPSNLMCLFFFFARCPFLFLFPLFSGLFFVRGGFFFRFWLDISRRIGLKRYPPPVCSIISTAYDTCVSSHALVRLAVSGIRYTYCCRSIESLTLTPPPLSTPGPMQCLSGDSWTSWALLQLMSVVHACRDIGMPA
jgi:hypothetical protein